MNALGMRGSCAIRDSAHATRRWVRVAVAADNIASRDAVGNVFENSDGEMKNASLRRRSTGRSQVGVEGDGGERVSEPDAALWNSSPEEPSSSSSSLGSSWSAQEEIELDVDRGQAPTLAV